MKISLWWDVIVHFPIRCMPPGPIVKLDNDGEAGWISDDREWAIDGICRRMQHTTGGWKLNFSSWISDEQDSKVKLRVRTKFRADMANIDCCSSRVGCTRPERSSAECATAECVIFNSARNAEGREIHKYLLRLSMGDGWASGRSHHSASPEAWVCCCYEIVMGGRRKSQNKNNESGHLLIEKCKIFRGGKSWRPKVIE